MGNFNHFEIYKFNEHSKNIYLLTLNYAALGQTKRQKHPFKKTKKC